MTKFALCIGLATVLGVAAPAFASQATSAPPPDARQPAATTTSKAARTDAKPARTVPAPGSRNCLRSTGSLIPAPKGQCLPVAGSSYSRQDLERTGAANIGRALQMLDPSVTIGH